MYARDELAKRERLRQVVVSADVQTRDAIRDLPACRQYPKPVQQPYPPIHFGGESLAAMRRVADLGQGWYPFAIEPAPLAARLGTLERLLAARGRSRRDVELSVCPYFRPVDLDLVQRYRAVGVDQVILLLIAPGVEELRRSLDELAEAIVEPARRL